MRIPRPGFLRARHEVFKCSGQRRREPEETELSCQKKCLLPFLSKRWIVCRRWGWRRIWVSYIISIDPSLTKGERIRGSSCTFFCKYVRWKDVHAACIFYITLYYILHCYCLLIHLTASFQSKGILKFSAARFVTTRDTTKCYQVKHWFQKWRGRGKKWDDIPRVGVLSGKHHHHHHHHHHHICLDQQQPPDKQCVTIEGTLDTLQKIQRPFSHLSGEGC